MGGFVACGVNVKKMAEKTVAFTTRGAVSNRLPRPPCRPGRKRGAVGRLGENKFHIPHAHDCDSVMSASGHVVRTALYRLPRQSMVSVKAAAMSVSNHIQVA